MSDAGDATTDHAYIAQPKVRTPDMYNRKYTELKKFLLQYDLYLELRKKDFDNETDKVYFAIVLLRDIAADWAEPYARQRLDKAATEQLLETRTIFADFDVFKQAIVNMFGDPGEERRAAGKLMTLRQAGSVVNYTAKFQQLYTKTGWDEKVSTDQFYRGLSDKIKDQIALGGKDCPKQLQEIIRIATDIRDRLYKRSIEKKEGHIAL
jgi:hypothetical protein